MKIQNEWNEIFRNNFVSPHGVTSLTVSKVKPNGQNARSIYNDDKDMIHKAANKYGFRVIINNDKLISFIKKVNL